MRVAVHVSDLVRDREGQIRWAVLATFVGTGCAEPRCIDYRIRVVPLGRLGDDQMSNLARFGQIVLDLDADAERDDRTDAWNLSEVDLRRRASRTTSSPGRPQARLLEKARKEVAGTPEQYKESARALLARQAKRRRGRPPARSLDEKLAILQTAEKVFAEGGAREDVAKLHHMSTSSVRDLLGWARKDVDPAPLHQ